MELGDLDYQDKLTRAPENVITEDEDKKECGGVHFRAVPSGRIGRQMPSRCPVPLSHPQRLNSYRDRLIHTFRRRRESNYICPFY